MDIDLQKLKERAEKATPGPWYLGKVNTHCLYPHEFGSAGPVPNSLCACTGHFEASADDNAAYIAAASPDVLLDLIYEIECLRKMVNDFKSKYSEQAVKIVNMAENLQGCQSRMLEVLSGEEMSKAFLIALLDLPQKLEKQARR